MFDNVAPYKKNGLPSTCFIRVLSVALIFLLALIPLGIAVSWTRPTIGLIHHFAGLAIGTPILTLVGLPTL
jgi:ABC-type arginine/histidine transport system permease subunit